MRYLICLLLTASGLCLHAGEVRVTVREDGKGLFLQEQFEVAAPLEKVWEFYTTSAGWRAWIAPVVEVDFRVGGTIKTHFDPKGKIGDPNTITLRIINYVPRRLITLQSEPNERMRAVSQQEQKDIFNVIEFEAIDGKRTRVTSHGIGYRDLPGHREVLEYFKRAGGAHYQKLIKALEK